MLGACVGFQIGGGGVSLAASCGNLGLHLVDELRAVHQQHLGALFGGGHCDTAPNTLRRAGHDDGLA